MKKRTFHLFSYSISLRPKSYMQNNKYRVNKVGKGLYCSKLHTMDLNVIKTSRTKSIFFFFYIYNYYCWKKITTRELYYYFNYVEN